MVQQCLPVPGRRKIGSHAARGSQRQPTSTPMDKPHTPDPGWNKPYLVTPLRGVTHIPGALHPGPDGDAAQSADRCVTPQSGITRSRPAARPQAPLRGAAPQSGANCIPPRSVGTKGNNWLRVRALRTSTAAAARTRRTLPGLLRWRRNRLNPRHGGTALHRGPGNRLNAWNGRPVLGGHGGSVLRGIVLSFHKGRPFQVERDKERCAN